LAQRTGMVVRELSPRGMDKLERARPAMLMTEAGRIWMPESAHWLDDAETELLIFTGDGKTKDDIVDCLSYATAMLDEEDDMGTDLPFVYGRRGY
jgi:phage terminase large subunit-like protein